MRHDGFRSSIYMLKHLEIWGIACALPAKKIATLIYLQPLGNMKGGKKTCMSDAQLCLSSESIGNIFSKQYP